MICAWRPAWTTTSASRSGSKPWPPSWSDGPTRPAPDGAEAAPPASPEGTSPGPLDQAQIELLRSLDDGEGAVLAEIVDQYLAQTVEGRG